LTRAVREGAICYLDEVVEARKAPPVVLHPLTDDRRILPLERNGETLHAPDGFMLVVSYNPGYQNLLKGMKPSTRQRFVAMTFDFPKPELEVEILIGETGIEAAAALRLVRLAGAFLQASGIRDRDCRFDVIAVDLDEDGKPGIRHIRDAFRA
jgi:nitric oxide reductase NorQ protein